ncbi:hypothetical protein TELCIR_20666 [Teladorsagia circumcincta]|uniref:Eyes absent homolog n=1 Tax=Teladorsagia circumcincta TaxID=45464 RepID=A0A2G9TIX0_TELCI|nr:hypothetical protein TELCIR_20666 [Teladorsagia circumcincta]
MSAQKEEINDACRQIEQLFGGRTDAARRCLEVVAQRTAVSSEKYANVVLCSDPLVAAVAQLLLAGLAPAVPIENIYSTSKAGREAVLDRIQNRFGKKCSYVVITSSAETNNLARKVLRGHYASNSIAFLIGLSCGLRSTCPTNGSAFLAPSSGQGQSPRPL